LHGAFGGEIFHENVANNWVETRLSAIYAAKFKLGSRWTLSPALRMGFQRLQYRGFYFVNGGLSDQVELTRSGLNFSPAVLLNTSNFYVGLSVDQLASSLLKLTTNYPTDFRLDPERVFKLQSGYRFEPRNSDKWSLAVTGLTAISNSFQEFQGNLMYNRRWLLVGAGVNYYSTVLGAGLNYQASLGYKHRAFRVMGVYATHSNQLDLSLMLYLPRKKATASPESSGR
jgi:hypothetical protein